MKNEAIIKSIEYLLCELKSLKNKEANNKDINSLLYLLGQSIRQYDIPAANCHISVCAKQRWEELSNDDIWKYWHRKQVKCDRLKFPKSFNVYKGSANTPVQTTLNPGLSFTFRDMFHEEHIIPVSLIMKKLINTSCIKIQTIKAILDSMHVCVILKEEDRRVNKQHGKIANRTGDFSQNEKNIYNTCGIILLPYNKFPYHPHP